MIRYQKNTFVMIPKIIIFSGIIVLALSCSHLSDGAEFGPKFSKGKGSQCVAETEFMRVNHMTVLVHQGNETLREGIRGGSFSLKKCITCHTTPGDDGRPVTFDSEQHFCRNCHDYAAVSIDCFTCHNSVPDIEKFTKNQSKLVLYPTFQELNNDE